MLDGKRGKAQKIVYKAFDLVQSKLNENPNDVFTKAMENITPSLEVKSRRVGGSNVQVPIEVSATRGETLALRWLVNASRARGGKSMAEKLANEIIDAANETGAAFKKKEDVHKMAEANKAFAHYRW
jgi:small subunit ribosomal protein S7